MLEVLQGMERTQLINAGAIDYADRPELEVGASERFMLRDFFGSDGYSVYNLNTPYPDDPDSALRASEWEEAQSLREYCERLAQLSRDRRLDKEVKAPPKKESQKPKVTGSAKRVCSPGKLADYKPQSAVSSKEAAIKELLAKIFEKEVEKMKQVKLICDGSCITDSRAGGWAVELSYNSHIKALSGWEVDTTSQRMELTAFLKGLEALKESCELTVSTDSQYLVGIFASGWKRKANHDLLAEIDKLLKKHKVVFEKIDGSDNRMDFLAKSESQKALSKIKSKRPRWVITETIDPLDILNMGNTLVRIEKVGPGKPNPTGTVGVFGSREDCVYFIEDSWTLSGRL